MVAHQAGILVVVVVVAHQEGILPPPHNPKVGTEPLNSDKVVEVVVALN